MILRTFVSVSQFPLWLQGSESWLADSIQSYLKYKGRTLDKSDSCLPLTLCFLLPVPLLRRGPHQTQRGDRGQRRTAHCQKEGCLKPTDPRTRPSLDLSCARPQFIWSYIIIAVTLHDTIKTDSGYSPEPKNKIQKVFEKKKNMDEFRFYTFHTVTLNQRSFEDR